MYLIKKHVSHKKNDLKDGWTHESDATAWELIKSLGDHFISLF